VFTFAMGAAVGGTLIGYLKNDDTGDTCEVHKDKKGAVEVKNCVETTDDKQKK
jgi:hypothetical protein